MLTMTPLPYRSFDEPCPTNADDFVAWKVRKDTHHDWWHTHYGQVARFNQSQRRIDAEFEVARDRIRQQSELDKQQLRRVVRAGIVAAALLAIAIYLT